VKEFAVLMMGISGVLMMVIGVRTAKSKSEGKLFGFALLIQAVWTLVYYFKTFL
jgi:hypothetical protein